MVRLGAAGAVEVAARARRQAVGHVRAVGADPEQGIERRLQGRDAHQIVARRRKGHREDLVAARRQADAGAALIVVGQIDRGARARRAQSEGGRGLAAIAAARGALIDGAVAVIVQIVAGLRPRLEALVLDAVTVVIRLVAGLDAHLRRAAGRVR